MLIPKEMRAYCPFCRKHQLHKVKIITSKARGGRALAQGNIRHEDKLLGYHGKVSGKKMVKKQGIKNKILLECTVCKKKHQRVISERLRKKAEISK